MHRWTQQLIPAELMGAHVASGASHTTGRVHTLHFRAGTAVWGHLGIEWDLAQATEQESAELAQWVAFHKDHRALLHSGRMIRLDAFDPALQIHGVVSTDRSEALFAVVATALPDVEPVGRFRLRGLDPDRHYRVRDVTPGAELRVREDTPGTDPHGFRRPPWWPGEKGIVLSGRSLQTAGVHAPGLWPDTLRILHLEAQPTVETSSQK